MSADIASLMDIRGAIDRALEFASGLNFERFSCDPRTMWAIYIQIIVIGEAANRVSQEFQQRHPALPWKKMIPMRHRLVHDYDEVDWVQVWDTVVSDLPMLKAAIEPLIPKEP